MNVPDNIWVQLGIATPFVALLWYLLKQATDERKEITVKFLAALTSTVEQSNDARIRSANELSILTQTIHDHQENSADEHQRIVDAIGKLGLREKP